MKKINAYILILGAIFLFTLDSCSDEDNLVIPDKKETRFDIPQGDHDFDNQIVEWYAKYGTSVLYKFTNPDLNYQIIKNADYDIKAEADEEGIAAAVQFLKEDFFDLYPDKVKKELFPSKILMAGKLYTKGNYVPLWDTISYGSYYFQRGIMVRGIDHITLPLVDKQFGQRISKPKYRERLKIAINRTFILFLMQPFNDIMSKIDYGNIINTCASYSLVEESAAQKGVTNAYSSDNKWYKEEDMYKLGFLEYGTYWYFWEPYYWSAPTDKVDDLFSFIEFIFSQTKSELHANPIYVNNPPIQKKCDYLIKTFAEYGIDLHCVGRTE